MQLNMTRAEEGLHPAGDYLADVKDVEAKYSKGGDQMLAVEFITVGEDSFTVYDVIMCEGKGWGIGKKKLQGLGVSDALDGEFDEKSLIGKRVYLHLAPDTYQGKTNLKPDIKQGTHMGISPCSDDPQDETETPF